MQWVTSPRPHVDRCATAWLVKRFVDPGATFGFVAAGAAIPKGATAFDMPGAKHGHRGKDCTFETVMKDHKLENDRALLAVAKLVHDLDFHEGKLPESAGLDAILRGLALAEPDDARVLERAAIVFDALYARAAAGGA